MLFEVLSRLAEVPSPTGKKCNVCGGQVSKFIERTPSTEPPMRGMFGFMMRRPDNIAWKRQCEGCGKCFTKNELDALTS